MSILSRSEAHLAGLIQPQAEALRRLVHPVHARVEGQVQAAVQRQGQQPLHIGR